MNIFVKLYRKITGKELPTTANAMSAFHKAIQKLEKVEKRHYAHVDKLERNIAALETQARISSNEALQAGRIAYKMQELVK